MSSIGLLVVAFSSFCIFVVVFYVVVDYSTIEIEYSVFGTVAVRARTVIDLL